MDIRGVEITNQLRSAIRAKLLELGVRYDEELPDYILVMVVNKKSRQQMNDDLNLFLEDSTEPFVDWLHDQVLKKLQKVTVAKKKSNKEVVLSDTVKQENDKKIKTEDLQESTSNESEKPVTKEERDREFDDLVGDLALLNEDDIKASANESGLPEKKAMKRKISDSGKELETDSSIPEKKTILTSSNTSPSRNEKNNDVDVEEPCNKGIDDKNERFSSEKMKCLPNKDNASNGASAKNENKINEKDKTNEKIKESEKENSHEKTETSVIDKSKHSVKSDVNTKEGISRLKSTITKPKITSVVSVKSRLGTVSPSNKSVSQSKSHSNSQNLSSSTNKINLDSKRREPISYSSSSNQSTDKNTLRSEASSTLKKRSDHPENSNSSLTEKHSKTRISKEDSKLGNKLGTVKSRLGLCNIRKDSESSSAQSLSSTKVSTLGSSNVKSRLGAAPKPKPKIITSIESRLFKLSQDDQEPEDEDDVHDSYFDDTTTTTSLKSHVIPVKKGNLVSLKGRKPSNITLRDDSESDIEFLDDDDDDDESFSEEDKKVSSKILVTPRPLKPLQPSQKRATQSLLFKAVAEANKSVVLQKKTDPCLKEQKALKKIKITRDAKKGKIVSINLNKKPSVKKKKEKRSSLEKIKVELSNKKKSTKPQKKSLKGVTDEHLDLVKSLFKKSDNKQKFLVTLNGYSSTPEEKTEDNEEHFIDLVDDDDDLYYSNDQYEFYDENDQTNNDQQQKHKKHQELDRQPDPEPAPLKPKPASIPEVKQQPKPTNYSAPQKSIKEPSVYDQLIQICKEKNSKNCKTQPDESLIRKRKNLSPIVFDKSNLKSNPAKRSMTKAPLVPSIMRMDKRPTLSSVITTLSDKSTEQCKFWPTCTLGIKCAYYHPEILCSTFPACKFGDKCSYVHPKCKFGTSCSKLGCKFSHPPMQCKYHPYCMKPGCQFSHPKKMPTPSISGPLTPDVSEIRAKFTWKKKD